MLAIVILKTGPEKPAMNFVPGDCGRKSRAGGWRQIQTNLLTDIETVELWELEHRRSKTVQIIIPIDCAFKYLWRAKSQSLDRDVKYMLNNTSRSLR